MPHTPGQPQARSTRLTDSQIALVEELCVRVSKGRFMHKVCQEDADMPATSEVFRWMGLDRRVADMLVRARETMADSLFEEALDIADDSSGDTMEIEDKNGRTYQKLDKEWVARSRLRVETRLKMVAKMNPKKYGEKLDITVEDNASKLSNEELYARLRAVDERLGLETPDREVLGL